MVVIMLLPPFMYATLRTSGVQRYIARKVTAYLSRELKTEVNVTGLDISWFLDVVLENVSVKDLHHETLVSITRLDFDFGKINISKRQILIRQLSLWKADVDLVTYKGDSVTNLQFLVDYFTSADTTPAVPSRPWKVRLQRVKLKQSHFLYQDQRYMQPVGPGMDYSNIDVENIDLAIDGLSMAGDTIDGNIHHLSCNELSGLEVHKLAAGVELCSHSLQMTNMTLITNSSNLSLDLLFRYQGYSGFNDFVDSVDMQVDIRPSVLNLQDISYFATALEGMDDELALSGTVKGPVSSLKVKDLNLAFGQITKFVGNISLKGLPDAEETFIQLKIKDFTTGSTDLASLRLPGNMADNKLVLPTQLNTLGRIKVKGIFTGFYNDFVANANFATDAGNVKTDLLLKNNEKTGLVEYDGHVSANRFDVGKVLDISRYAGITNLNVEVKGKGLSTETVDLVINGTVDSADFYGNNFNKADIKGRLLRKTFDGTLKLTDELVKLDFNGLIDYTQQVPEFNFDARIENAMLTGLHLWHRDSLSKLSTLIHCNFTGDRIDDMLGFLLLESTTYTENGKSYEMKQLLLNIDTIQNQKKNLSLSSDFVDAEFAGQYTFDDFFHYLNNVFDKYLPSLRYSQFATTAALMENRKFDYVINLKNTRAITEIFLPALKLDNKTRLSGSFDSNSGMVKLNGSSPLIEYKGISFVNWFIVGSTQSNSFKMNTGCFRIMSGDSAAPEIEQVSALFNVQADSIAIKIGWDDFDKKDHNKADIKVTAVFSGYPAITLKVADAWAMINDSLWTMKTGNYIRIDTSSIFVNDFQINGNNQGIRANGCISEDPPDKLTLTFDRFNISYLDLLLENTGIDFDGFLSGSFDISGMYDVPNYIADLVVKDFYFNKEKLGDFTLKSSWNQTLGAIVLDSRILYTGNAGTIETLLAKGYFYPNRKKDNFDINATLLNYKISTLSPFFTGLFSNLKGLATGSLQLKGDLVAPVLLGSVKLMRTELKVNYNNITYSFATDFNLKKDLMWFDNVTLYDSLGNSAIASGKIYHQNFIKWRLDIAIDAKKIAGLHTTVAQNELFYGDAFGSGKVEIKGPVENLVINIAMRTEKGTNIFLPYSSTTSVSQQNFIEFINPDDSAHTIAARPDAHGGITINLGFDVTKDAGIQFFLPDQMGDIRVKGDGKIIMGIDKNDDFTIRGTYTMDQGTFLFTLQKLINRSFSIVAGSSITWSGDPYNADVDIIALYKTKVSLSGIPALANDPNMQGKRTQVDCILKMKNSLMRPDIYFNFRMPSLDDPTRQTVYNAIDTNSVAEMNKQMISLLALNSFSFSTENTNFVNSLGASSFDMLSSQISNQLSQISKAFDVGVRYSPGDKLSPEELEVALSTQLFNDRVIIDGSVATNNYTTSATGTSGTSGTSANTSKLVGDINVEYKITPDGQVRLKAFNRSNNNVDYLSNYAAYTQGVGVFYRREFDRLSDLFRRQRKMP